jgi:AcrR family transcriptional regulator
MDADNSERSEKWFARRDEVVDIAARLFADRGYHATGLAELCDAVGLGRGALYYYIGSKESLLDLIHDRVMSRLLSGAEEVLTGTGTAADKLTRIGEQLLDIITTYPDHVSTFLHEFRVLTGERAASFRASRARYEGMIEQVLSDGVRSGEFEIRDTRLATLAWLDLYNYTYIWLPAAKNYRPDKVADEFARIFIGGISAKQPTRTAAGKATRARRG